MFHQLLTAAWETVRKTTLVLGLSLVSVTLFLISGLFSVLTAVRFACGLLGSGAMGILCFVCHK